MNFYREENFYATVLELFFFFFFFLPNDRTFFSYKNEKVKNPAKYELFLPEPLTMTLFR